MFQRKWLDLIFSFKNIVNDIIRGRIFDVLRVLGRNYDETCVFRIIRVGNAWNTDRMG